ncbi:MAG: hypothetical protein ACI9MC_001198 [Kiritimatiellia bacterium]|jgi:hypothetical protein
MSTTILTSDDLTALRGQFDNTIMLEAAMASVNAGNSRGACWTLLSVNQFFMQDESEASKLSATDGVTPGMSRVLSRSEVEIALIPVLLVGRHHWAFAVHVYWSLCIADDPLTPGHLYDVVLLTSTYAGIQVLTEGNAVLTATLNLLKARLDAGDPVDVVSVVRAITGLLLPVVPGLAFAPIAPTAT